MKLKQRLVRPYIWHELPGWGKLYRTVVGGYQRDHEWADEPRQKVRGKLHGYLLDLDLSRWSERSTYFLGRFYDLEMQLLLLGLLRPGDRFVDVGANIGMITLLGARIVGDTGVVDSFEPNPRCGERVESFLNANGIENVRLHRVGLGDREAELCLQVPVTNAGEGTFLPFPKKGDADAAEERIDRVTVPVRVGDAILEADSRPPVMIKMDVEGFECYALKGLERTLRRHRPIVATEVSTEHLQRAGLTPANLFQIMQPLGYEAWKMGLKRKAFRYHFTLEPINPTDSFYNALWIPDGGDARQRFVENFPGLGIRP